MPDAPAEIAPRFSVVILCFRAGEHARDFALEVEKHLEREGIDFEIVLVANFWPGMTDATPETAARLVAERPRMRCVSRPKRGGMGEDMLAGLAAARGSELAVIDGDRQMLAEDIVKCWRVLVEQRADLVKTTRVRRNDGFYRGLVTRMYNALMHVMFPGIQGWDMNSKPKVLTRAAYEKMSLSSQDWFIDAEIMLEARRHRMKVVEIPTVFLRNEHRGSFVGFSTNFEFLRNILRAWRR